MDGLFHRPRCTRCGGELREADIDSALFDGGRVPLTSLAPVGGQSVQATVKVNMEQSRLHVAGARLEKALAGFEQAVRADPTHAPAWFNLAVTLDDLGRPDDALTALDRYLALRPQLPDGHLRRAQVLTRQDRPAAALVSFDRAVQVDPRCWPAHLGRAGVLADVGRHTEALAALGRVSRSVADPRLWAGGQQIRARCLLRLGQPDGALVAVDEALRTLPLDVAAHSLRADILSALNRPEDAHEARAHAARLPARATPRRPTS
ncbi:hypothetical protein BL253_09315 [Pseudofrankia asymbiotica]|uniref:Uncharacterized protein n=2 Tax=Pseudofrankia asymbiotica TaxID=1834516 RepID=A0A1V2IEV4_9ACTN|nr:hypothetical protein BL253_09315 [Pseudofrankia asymbiotica]